MKYNREKAIELCNDLINSPKYQDSHSSFILSVEESENIVKAFLAEVSIRETFESELTEQCRLNGMGSEREARLMTKRDTAVEALQYCLGVMEADQINSPLNSRGKYIAKAYQALQKIGLNEGLV